MKRPAFALVAALSVATFALGACTHDWSLPLTGDDAGGGTDTGARDVVADAPDASTFDCTGALVCDTFDGPPLGATWDDIAVAAGGGKAAIEPFGAAVSGANVFAAERPAQTDGNSTAYVDKLRTGALTKARMELQVWPIALDAKEYATVAAIVFDHQGAGEHKIRLALNQTSAQLQELGPSSVIASHDFPAALPIDAWTRVAFEIDGQTIRAFVGGTKVVDVQAGPGWKPSTRSLFVAGINFVTRPHQRVSLRFDNVRVDGS